MKAFMKPINPKDACGIRKAPVSVIPVPVLAEVGLAMLEGALKYGRHNYRKTGVRGSVYYDSVWRHMANWWEGEDLDPDSGIHHISKAIAGLIVLRDSMMRGNWVDDRPPKSKPCWLAEMNQMASALIDKYPNPCLPILKPTQRRKQMKIAKPVLDVSLRCTRCKRVIAAFEDYWIKSEIGKHQANLCVRCFPQKVGR